MTQCVQAGTMPMTLQEVARSVSGRLIPVDGSEPIDGGAAQSVPLRVVSDSRQAGEGSLFVAIRGERVDGHDFLPGMGARGVCAALVDHPVSGADLPQILVDDTVEALGLLAKHNIELRRAAGTDFTVIGITGSVGKTTTKDLLASLLSALGTVVAPVGSFNNEIGLPLTALQVGEGTRFLVAEMGANHIGEIAHLTRIVPPDLALVLKVGVAHLGEFGSVDRIAQAKSEMVQGLVPGGLAVLNADDSRVAAMAPLSSGGVLRFGMDEESSGLDARATDVVRDGLDRPSFTLTFAGADPVRVHLGISGMHNVMNALAAAAVAHHLGLDPDAIAEGLGRDARISPHRMAVGTVRTDRAGFTLIDDSFNANPDSMRAGLDALSTWQGTGNQGKPYRVAVLGVMLELGDQAAQLHEQIGAYCRRLDLDALVAVGCDDASANDLVRAMVRGAGGETEGSDAPMQVIYAPDANRAGEMVEGLAAEHPGALVLLKGSHMSGLSALADRWQG